MDGATDTARDAGFEAEWWRYRLDFKFEAITSRTRMRHKDTYFIRLTDTDTGASAIAEVPLFKGLGKEDTPDFEARLDAWTRNPSLDSVPSLSSLRFGVESAVARLYGFADSPFLRGEAGIPINGLVWMGDKTTMRRRIDEKLDAGFRVLKLKIGGIDFDDELRLLRYVRETYSPSVLELRLDANGSFSPADALPRLDRLSRFAIHSLEQPIMAGNVGEMARICRNSPIPIALDEELIGVSDTPTINRTLSDIMPAYIVLKPALCGGFSGADAWIGEAERLGIGWWATSALESNVGLEDIARWLTTAHDISMPQGLGTGQLYTNNFPSPLCLRGSSLFYIKD